MHAPYFPTFDLNSGNTHLVTLLLVYYTPGPKKLLKVSVFSSISLLLHRFTLHGFMIVGGEIRFIFSSLKLHPKLHVSFRPAAFELTKRLQLKDRWLADRIVLASIIARQQNATSRKANGFTIHCGAESCAAQWYLVIHAMYRGSWKNSVLLRHLRPLALLCDDC